MLVTLFTTVFSLYCVCVCVLCLCVPVGLCVSCVCVCVCVSYILFRCQPVQSSAYLSTVERRWPDKEWNYKAKPDPLGIVCVCVCVFQRETWWEGKRKKIESTVCKVPDDVYDCRSVCLCSCVYQRGSRSIIEVWSISAAAFCVRLMVERTPKALSL